MELNLIRYPIVYTSKERAFHKLQTLQFVIQNIKHFRVIVNYLARGNHFLEKIQNIFGCKSEIPEHMKLKPGMGDHLYVSNKLTKFQQNPRG